MWGPEVPTGLIVHQVDHLEVWNIEPLDVGRPRLTTSVYAPAEPQSEGSREYYAKIEPALAHFHREVNRAIDNAPQAANLSGRPACGIMTE